MRRGHYLGNATVRAVTRQRVRETLSRYGMSRKEFRELERMAADEAWAWTWQRDDWYHG